MASSPFTLAALATSAVPGLTVSAVDLNEDRGGDFVSAKIVGDGRDLLVRVPRTPAAEVAQSAELLSLAALAEGARAALPFEVPETLGITRAGDSRAVVTTLLDGARIEVEDLESEALLLQPIAEAIAAVHALPTALVQQGGLPVRDAVEVRAQIARLVDRAQRTRLLPETVHHRWMEALEATALWDFAPTPVHGAFTAEVLLVADDRVVGVLDWSEFAVGDPAADLAWLLAAGDDVFETVLARYAAISDTGHVGWLRARAKLYRELEVAEWLMHGVEAHDQDVVSDAVAMLDRMVDRLSRMSSPVPAHTALGSAEVAQLLDETPDAPDGLSETAAFEALDEDRMFHADTDFIEPLDESTEHPGNDDSDSGAARGDAAGTGTDAPEGATEAPGAGDAGDTGTPLDSPDASDENAGPADRDVAGKPGKAGRSTKRAQPGTGRKPSRTQQDRPDRGLEDADREVFGDADEQATDVIEPLDGDPRTR